MKKILSLVAVAVFMFACGGPQQKTETEEFSALSIKSVMENVDQYVGDTVTVKGTVGHVCRHGGDKMFLVCTESDQKLKVELSGDLTSFSPEMEGLTYAVTGVVEGIKIDEEYLVKWEQELASKEHEGDVEGHDDTPSGEKADMGEHKGSCEQIKTYREQIAASEGGFIMFYTLKAFKIEKVEAEAVEVDPAAKTEEPAVEEKPAVE